MRFNIREVEKLEELAKYYLTNISTLQSFNRTREMINLSMDTAERLSRYFSFSLKEQILNPKKVYCMDSGLRNIVSFKFTEDLRRISENIAFLKLFRTNREVFYWKDYQQREVDFVVKEGLRVKQLIQVTCASGRDEIENGEIRSLLKASEQLRCKNLSVITWDYEGEEEFKNKKINFIPLWRYLLEQSL